MGFFDKIADFINGSIGDAVDSVNTGIFNSIPNSCAYCIMCRRIAKELPSGKKVYIFTCPKKDFSNYFPSTLPALPANETDEEKQREYIEKFYNYYNSEHSNFISQSHGTDSGALSLCNKNSKPINSESVENLNFCPDVYYCDQYRPYIVEGVPSFYYPIMDSYGDATPINEYEYDALSAEDKLQITGRTY